MKSIIRRNQIIITALAILIAVAGYLNYAREKPLSDVGVNVTEPTTTNLEDDLLASLEDIESNDNDPNEEETTPVSGQPKDKDEESGKKDEKDAEKDAKKSAEANNSDTQNPGDAMFVNTTSFGFVMEARLNREQVRARNKEILMEIVNNANVSEDQKQSAINNMIAMTDISEKESAAEMLLAAKGFEETVVTIENGKVDVVVCMTDITDAMRAQIEDVIKRKTEVTAENIIITPLRENEKK